MGGGMFANKTFANWRRSTECAGESIVDVGQLAKVRWGISVVTQRYYERVPSSTPNDLQATLDKIVDEKYQKYQQLKILEKEEQRIVDEEKKIQDKKKKIEEYKKKIQEEDPRRRDDG
ncbi:unnamed protein product [Rotaria socialis]|uniref:Uncharacterized protein n=1 Tax=Rotaria socialis TaxID=392032 RepID=A0A820SYD1_9BILA|nr:unnamed protein product [Rotaria socialis]CAF4504379.1 unnamed protein product [Rotaria socialis]CAF4857803.1 unnamed protein product [Rotaria socialis]